MINLIKFYKKFIKILALLFVFSPISAQTHIDLNCFTIVVGKNVSTDGSVLVAHNEDDFGKQIVNLYKIPPGNHRVDDIIKLNNGGRVKQVKKTNGSIWIELPGMKVADSYINDKGVVITSNGCPSREETPDSTDGGILYWLRRIVSERAGNARDAVKIAGNLIDNYGYVSSGRTYTFADNNEAWIFCAVYGKHWIAQRVPDDKVSIIPNYYTIGEVNLSDSLNYLGSEDIVEHAIENSWYDPDLGIKFNFAKAYTALSSINHPGNIDRIWRGISLLSQNNYPIDKDLPFSFSPYKKLNTQDLMQVLRDHYEECELDKSQMYSKGNPHKVNNATICSGATQYSFVAQLRKNMPVEIGTVIWLTYFRPGINIYSPLYLGLQKFNIQFSPNNCVSAIDNHFNPPQSIFKSNPNHAYWNFVDAVNKVDQNFNKSFSKVRYQNGFIERDILKRNSVFENTVLELYPKNPNKVLLMLTDYSNKGLLNARKRAIDIYNSDYLSN